MADLPPHHSPSRNWVVEYHSHPSLRYEAFRDMAEARGRADALAILDDADGKTLATYPLRRIEASEEDLNQLLVELEDVAARLRDWPPPEAHGRVFYEPPDVFRLIYDTAVDRLWLHEDLYLAGLGGAVEAVFRGVASRLDPEAVARIPLVQEWWPAVEKGDLDAVRGLLERGVPVDTPDKWRKTALDHASRAGEPAMIRLLLDRGADPNTVDHSSWTSVTAAARWADRGVVEMLIAAGGRVGLREAVLMGDVDLAREILEAEPTIDVSASARFVYSYSFLMLAVSKGDLDMVRLLIDRGADLRSTDDDIGYQALGIAAADGRTAFVELLLDRGADIDHEDWSGRTALAEAAAFGHDEAVALLIARGARRSLPDAAYLGDEALVARLLADGADPGREPDFASPLRIAVKRGHAAIVARLLNAGPVENWSGYSSDRTMVAEAAATGRLDVVRVLVDHGLDPREVGGDGLSPLEWAEREGHAEVADYLRGLT
ncbi:ankyrin repeat domain-containing protein [Paludisphaera rhizosphaerae]|uniref:ankyrin repeat domain-containing protein n=1 Tax=Paludisphaera rhizosphaerae TaxID=2711216 RepID=UPI0013EDBD4B|nr:ankyrin repeat domain-containing protein [Paludisphaera rhizosphaerae]